MEGGSTAPVSVEEKKERSKERQTQQNLSFLPAYQAWREGGSTAPVSVNVMTEPRGAPDTAGGEGEDTERSGQGATNIGGIT